MPLQKTQKKGPTQGPQITLRNATAGDLSAVLELQAAWAVEDLAYNYTTDTRDFLKRRLGDFFIVAVEANVVVGFSVGTLLVNTELSIFQHGERYLMIEDVYVQKGGRSLGLGSVLVQELVQRAEAQGVHRCLVYSSIKELDPILNFYRKNGFKTWNIQFFK